jgi:hypothetical protein
MLDTGGRIRAWLQPCHRMVKIKLGLLAPEAAISSARFGTPEGVPCPENLGQNPSPGSPALRDRDPLPRGEGA